MIIMIFGTLIFLVGIVCRLAADNGLEKLDNLEAKFDMMFNDRSEYSEKLDFYRSMGEIGRILLLAGILLLIVGLVVYIIKENINSQDGQESGDSTLKDGMICSKCGRTYSIDMVYCSKCGVELEKNDDILFCTKCGSKCSKKDSFCFKCGSKLDSGE